MKPFEFHNVEEEKAEAIRRYNNRISYQNILRAIVAVASLCYMWLPTVPISLQPIGDWFIRTGSVIIITNRTGIVFFFANLLVVLIFLASRDREEDCSCKQDLYDEYTSSAAVIVTTTVSADKVEDENSKKQIVPALIAEVNREVVKTRSYRRTRSETRKEILRPVREYRRMESENAAMERLSSEEFRLRVEKFIMEKKRSLVR